MIGIIMSLYKSLNLMKNAPKSQSCHCIVNKVVRSVMCANSRIRRMPDTIHAIFINIDHKYFRSMNPLNSEVKSQGYANLVVM